MRVYLQCVKTTTFFKAVNEAVYNPLDEREAYEFGYRNVKDAYRSAKIGYARFYLVKHGDDVLVPILLQRDGMLIFFTTNKLQDANVHGLVRVLRKIARKTVHGCGSIFCISAPWYDQANKLLKITGFRIVRKRPDMIEWVNDGK